MKLYYVAPLNVFLKLRREHRSQLLVTTAKRLDQLDDCIDREDFSKGTLDDLKAATKAYLDLWKHLDDPFPR